MLKQLTYIPVTEDSRPFGAAAKTCGFHEAGWVENGCIKAALPSEEYFLRKR